MNQPLHPDDELAEARAEAVAEIRYAAEIEAGVEPGTTCFACGGTGLDPESTEDAIKMCALCGGKGTTRYDGPFRKPLPCLECGGEVVWRYADDGHGDVDSIGECRSCGSWY